DNNEINKCEECDSSTSIYSDNYVNSQFSKKEKELSTMWKYFKKIKKSGKWKCKRCPSKYEKNTSTSTL
ncbi:405_t:CDS:1, partial [Racocetra persica]